MSDILSRNNQKIRKFFRRFPVFVILVRTFRKVTYTLASVFPKILFNKNHFITRKNASYFGDGFATTHYVPFLDDLKFVNSYNNSFLEVKDRINYWMKDVDVIWRAHICTWAAVQAERLEGDFVECGVWYGILSKTMCNYVDFNMKKRKFYLFDTWGGEEKQKMITKKNAYQEDIFDFVKKRFSAFKNVTLIRGLVPDTFTQVKIDKIAYLGIDMNGSIAERHTLEYFYPKLVTGGVIYLDDYGWNHPELRKTVDDFFNDKPEKLLHFPSGNSIIIKL